MGREVYCIFSCDEWKSKESMRFLSVCSSLSKLRQVLFSGIKTAVFEYDDGKRGSFSQQSKRFRNDWRTEMTQTVFPDVTVDAVKYAYVEICTLNENPFNNVAAMEVKQ